MAPRLGIISPLLMELSYVLTAFIGSIRIVGESQAKLVYPRRLVRPIVEPRAFVIYIGAFVSGPGGKRYYGHFYTLLLIGVNLGAQGKFVIKHYHFLFVPWQVYVEELGKIQEGVEAFGRSKKFKGGPKPVGAAPAE